jgi:hypothetical protein
MHNPGSVFLCLDLARFRFLVMIVNNAVMHVIATLSFRYWSSESAML